MAGSPFPASSRYEQFLIPSKEPARGSPSDEPPDPVFFGGTLSWVNRGALREVFWTSLPAETLFLTTSTLGVLCPKAEKLIPL